MAVRVIELAPKVDKHFRDDSPYVAAKNVPYLLRPNHTIDTLSPTGEFRVVIHSNSAGFRDSEHSQTKAKNVYRILGLGDSFTMGAGVLFEDTWLAVLEKMLNKREGPHPTVEIIKAGLGGFYPEVERLLLRHHGLSYNPDFLIVGFNTTDIEDTARGVDEIKIHDGYLKTSFARRMGWLGTFAYLNSHLAPNRNQHTEAL